LWTGRERGRRFFVTQSAGSNAAIHRNARETLSARVAEYGDVFVQGWL